MATKKTPRTNTCALTIHFEDKDGRKSKVEIHPMNPGELLPNFGGSKHGLLVGKTVSMVTRTYNVGCSDYEGDIYDANFWAWISRLINRVDTDGKPFNECTVTAVATAKEE